MAVRTADWWIVECLRAPVRRAPSTDAGVLAEVRLGDEVQVAASRAEGGRRWLRVTRQCLVDRLDGRGPVPLSLPADGFLLAEDPARGELLLPRYHWQLFEVDAPGLLPREELRRRAQAGGAAVLPLEARLWTPTQLRPARGAAGGSPGVPGAPGAGAQGAAAGAPGAEAPGAEALGAALERAARWLAGAEALLVASGDPGGPEPQAGAWAWPGLREHGLECFEQACSADWFRQDPGRGQALWDFCRAEARARAPSEAARALCGSARGAPHGACLLTSAWDGSWAAAGWGGGLVELHGSMHWRQCSRPEACNLEVWGAPAAEGPQDEQGGRGQASGGWPACPNCGAAARPNVQMYNGDYAFSKRRIRTQMTAYNEWLRSLETSERADGLRLVCLELECGFAVPTLRREVESVMRRFPSACLIRVNSESADVLKSLEERCVALRLGAEAALGALQARQYRHWEAAVATFVVWDEEGGGTEVVHEREASVAEVLRAAAETPGAGAALRGAGCAPVRAVAVAPEMGEGRRLALDRRLPPWYFFEDARPPPEGGWRAPWTAVLAVAGRAFAGQSDALCARVEEAEALLAAAPTAPRLGGAAALERLLAAAAPGSPGLRAAARPAARPGRPARRHDDWELAPAGGPRFCIVGSWDGWAAVHDMLWDGAGCYLFYVRLGTAAWESFQILQEGSWERTLFPSCRDGSPHVPHTLCGPRKDGGHGRNWSIGMHKNDAAARGARYAVRLQVSEAWAPQRVEWTKLDAVTAAEEDAVERGFFQAGQGAAARAA